MQERNPFCGKVITGKTPRIQQFTTGKENPLEKTLGRSACVPEEVNK